MENFNQPYTLAARLHGTFVLVRVAKAAVLPEMTILASMGKQMRLVNIICLSHLDKMLVGQNKCICFNSNRKSKVSEMQ